jgi:phage terminase large subunit GpA-like protein
MATAFVAAQRDPIRLRTFVSTILGQTWREQGEAPEWERLWRRRGPYAEGTCPGGVLFLTAGADVQKNRLVVEVVGWGKGKRTWSITWCELEGDTADLGPDGPWAALEQLMRANFPHELGGEMPIRLTAIDSGNWAATVYDFCRKFSAATMAVKGIGSLGLIVGSPTVVDLTARGTAVKGRPLKLWPVGDDLPKREFYGWLHLERPADGGDVAPGFCHFPADYDAEPFKQYTAEQLVQRHSRSHRNAPPREEWEVIPGRQNQVIEEGSRYGLLAARVCGAGGGGCVALLSDPARRDGLGILNGFES